MSWIFAILSIICLYLLRFFTEINSYLFLTIIEIVFIALCISFCCILNINNYLIEKIALLCGEDADHARNIA